jgi:hypothetical protein
MRIVKHVAAILLLAALATPSLAADKNYTRGSVWITSLIRSEPGKQDDYVDSLKRQYTTLYEEALKEKVILSYKILLGNSANPEDWDVLILTEVPSFAAFDTLEAKFDAIGEKLMGSQEKSDEAVKKDMADRSAIRKIFGGKLLQEIHYTK